MYRKNGKQKLKGYVEPEIALPRASRNLVVSRVSYVLLSTDKTTGFNRQKNIYVA